MEKSVISGLEPKEFFRWFYETSKIPHGSKNERQLVEFLIDFAKERSIFYEVDKKGNVFMTLPASEGYENQPKILFEAHLDMVLVKDEGLDFDFIKDSVKLKIDGDKLTADGTSLGADNLVGVATMLAIADSKEIKHPPLELLFTVEEEIGLIGIRNFDLSKITARRMVNMDSGDSHVLAVCSSGSRRGEISCQFNLECVGEKTCALTLLLDGGIGGHSSLEAGKGRACAVNCLVELISFSCDKNISLISLESKGNPIFSSAKATILVSKDQESSVREELEKKFSEIKARFKQTDPNIRLTILDEKMPKKALSSLDAKRVLRLLGLVKMQTYLDEKDSFSIKSLTTLYKVSLVEDKFFAKFGVRSFSDADLDAIYSSCQNNAKALGFNVELKDYYPGWEEKKDSKFREKFIEVHKELFSGELPGIERVQGGIETCIITKGIPDMDAVGVAPTARGAHTTKEYIKISETLDFWKWLLEVLSKKE